MSVRLFQQMTRQMKEVMNRDLGIITDSGFVVSSNDACISNNDLECVLSFTEENTDTFTYNGFTYKPIVSMGKVDYIIFVKGDDTLARNYSRYSQYSDYNRCKGINSYMYAPMGSQCIYSYG